MTSFGPLKRDGLKLLQMDLLGSHQHGGKELACTREGAYQFVHAPGTEKFLYTIGSKQATRNSGIQNKRAANKK